MNCRYGEHFGSLIELEDDFKDDWLIAQHLPKVLREVRIRAYAQALQPYQSLGMQSMADSFGLSIDTLDK